MSIRATVEGLRTLARLHGVRPWYEDMAGRPVVVGPEALIGVLRALGAPVGSAADVTTALRERRHALRSRLIEPVIVAWRGRHASALLRLPEADARAAVACELALEGGEHHRWIEDLDRLPTVGRRASEGLHLVTKRVELPHGMPVGYHRLRIDHRGGTAEAMIISASVETYGDGPEAAGERLWGLFCPLHALHAARSWGAGDFTDLGAMIDWVADRGGSLVATLPMLASAVTGKASVSPYSPASRLFWNEFYLDVSAIPELAACPEARALLDAPEHRVAVAALRAEPLVDYGREMARKRPLLERLARWFFDGPAAASADYRAFLAANPEVEAYARFMARGEQHGPRWSDWPADLADDATDPPGMAYHLFAQWQADRQLGALAENVRRRGLTWYLDFPVGVDANSFDAWRYRDAFSPGATVGCPPDPTFPTGQNWGFPPPHPEAQRQAGYEYFIASLRGQFRYANALRIDHVMGLHRLFWVPAGLDARSGAFVEYPAEEVYAILSVESHRGKAWLVGEDLGTVPARVQQAMGQHRVRGMFVIQYELAWPEPDRSAALGRVPRASVASVNTHDMPPFAAYWTGDDIDDRLDLHLIDADAAARERAERADQRRSLVAFLRGCGLLDPTQDGDDEADPAAVLEACSAYLAASPAHVAMFNLEDFWLEDRAQNVPNTSDERPNWRRKHRKAMEEIQADPAIAALLDRLARLRKEGGSPRAAAASSAPSAPAS